MIPQVLCPTHKCLLLIVLILSAENAEVAQADAPIARPGCQDTCGNVGIPFPFGIGPNCFLDSWFEIVCRVSANGSTRPFLSKLDIEVMEVNGTHSISYQSYGSYQSMTYERRSMIVGIPPLNMCSADAQHQQLTGVDLRGGPYQFSTSVNVFVLEGCAGSAVLVNQSTEVMSGCATICNNNNKNNNVVRDCYGVRCCQTPLSGDPFQFYQIQFNPEKLGEGQNCLKGSLIKIDSLNHYVGMLSPSDPFLAAPVVLYWNWTRNLQPDYNPQAYCYQNKTNIDYCRCKDGYLGNPYVTNGCQVPEECKLCVGYCAQDYADRQRYYCEKSLKALISKYSVVAGLTISFGIMLFLIGCYMLYRFIKRRREMKRRATFFERNGGLLLERHLSSNQGVVERTKVFTVDELDKATDRFNENRILGEGGQGTVYKGMLSDGSIVAIKKSKALDDTQLEQFINEFVILSRTNHRNIVKLFGCCLETEMPLLVYEFVPNGTLSQHIHDPDEDFAINWEMLLKIAVESASAIAYLHSSSSIPIYHRDIKSSNILLDDKYRAKVSDFGCSKTFAIDQTHLTTLVQGTLGYLDPEYFQTFQFTDKSDVFSFGVLLLELLTGKQPIYRLESMEQKNLVTEFLSFMQHSRLSDILDYRIVRDAKEEELTTIVGLAKRCISWNGKLRPTMKEVAMTLEMIIKSRAQGTLNEEVVMKEMEITDHGDN